MKENVKYVVLENFLWNTFALENYYGRPSSFGDLLKLGEIKKDFKNLYIIRYPFYCFSRTDFNNLVSIFLKYFDLLDEKI
jgi:hypothetical protein